MRGNIWLLKKSLQKHSSIYYVTDKGALHEQYPKNHDTGIVHEKLEK